ncbi:pentapeptide repeat-containing protein [Streptomyces sp. N2-109]|uniref:Pentapeptide repeat-containing protein n=1 Tax=Streptomyces gossypii TaxID=2883101 RepID=A0ABT2JTL0_9ACTN|nr:pentapeptide repeat-containing protein [Streptomyces gossypii]MCT2591215.1 pentapeptide repeat-containing protein [Streptomyces gossypii]
MPGVVTAGLALWIFGPGAGWVVEHVDGVHGLTGEQDAQAKNNVRGRMLQAGAGLLATVAVFYTARTYRLSQQQQVTDRYTTTVEQLGSASLEVRLGGIYALERIARDSPRDHGAVMAVLAAFVRERSRDEDAHPAMGEAYGQTSGQQVRLRGDLQAALSAIGRRDHRSDSGKIYLSDADLRGADLRGAYLAGAGMRGSDLSGVNFGDCNLVGANLVGANLAGSALGGDMRGIRLKDADLTGAWLAGVPLHGADLTRAKLSGANLAGADLRGANLEDADLTDADLTGALR